MQMIKDSPEEIDRTNPLRNISPVNRFFNACEFCHYFAQHADPYARVGGRCLYNPPFRDREWPFVLLTDWCGFYKKRESNEEKRWNYTHR
jgi:hypothetical protein